MNARTATAKTSTTSTTETMQGVRQLCLSRRTLQTNCCDGANDCLYWFARDCSFFIQCTCDHKKKVKPHRRECSKGLYSNDYKKNCDYTCLMITITTSTTTSTTTKSSTTFKPTLTVGVSSQPTTQCPQFYAFSSPNNCKKVKDCLFPNPCGCGSYIQCSVNPYGKPGTPIFKPRPGEKLWNHNEKECAIKSNSNAT